MSKQQKNWCTHSGQDITEKVYALSWCKPVKWHDYKGRQLRLCQGFSKPESVTLWSLCKLENTAKWSSSSVLSICQESVHSEEKGYQNGAPGNPFFLYNHVCHWEKEVEPKRLHPWSRFMVRNSAPPVALFWCHFQRWSCFRPNKGPKQLHPG